MIVHFETSLASGFCFYSSRQNLYVLWRESRYENRMFRSLAQKIVNACVPRQNEMDLESERILYRQARLLLIYSLFVALPLFFYSYLYLYVLNSMPLFWCTFLSGMVAFLTGPLFRITGLYSFSVNVMTGTCCTAIIAISALTGGSDSIVLYWIAMVPLVAGVMISNKAVLVWGIVALATPLAFLVYEKNIGPFPMELNVNLIKIITISSVLGITAMGMFFTYIFGRTMRQTLKQLGEKKDEVVNLLRVLTHDLSSPLTVVDFLTEDLDEQTHMTTKSKLQLKNAMSRILEILDQVKHMHSVESGKNGNEIAPVNLSVLIDSATELFDVILKAKNLTIKYQDGIGDIQVLAEARSLQNQVLSNLISNAIKFSLPGGIIYIRTSEQNNKVFLTVEDEGIGMPKEIIGNLFCPSKKTSRKGTMGETGTGFGMPLVKAYVEQYEGTISVSSQCMSDSPDSHGSQVTVKLKKAS